MNIHLVFPKLPPAHDAIGDHTGHLATTLAQTCRVSVLTTEDTYDPLPGVSVRTAFSIKQRREVRGILDALEAEQPDWLLLQYNAFSYGLWGLNLHLPAMLRTLKQKYPKVRCAVMAHETWPPSINARLMIMSTWQRWQLWQLGHTADLMFFSIEPWVKKFQKWFPQIPVRHLPVGSNMPYVGIERQEARSALGIADHTFVIGVFGKVHHSRMLSHVKAAAQAVHHECKNESMQVLYIGPHGKEVAKSLPGIPLLDAGRLEPESVSRHFAAMDLYLSPFTRGVSTRRGSFMTALQHGIATVSTQGIHTDAILKQHNGKAFLLADEQDLNHFCQQVVELYSDNQRRQEIAKAARRLYQTAFAWEVIASQLVATLEEVNS
ncbi:MAG: glycosyltransferase family 4 protein [Symploca sp. SIO2C1]|nr:glycosyltransferase family 4 protein [Symploca sp. SIO2C1]